MSVCMRAGPITTLLFVGQVCPVAMIFIPPRSGHSPRSEQYTTPEESGNGVTVLALTLARLAGGEA